MINAKRLDDICKESRIDNIHFMKINVEGAELEVLRSAEEYLSKNKIQTILFESGKDILKVSLLQKKYGYVIENLGGYYYLAKATDLIK